MMITECAFSMFSLTWSTALVGFVMPLFDGQSLSSAGVGALRGVEPDASEACLPSTALEQLQRNGGGRASSRPSGCELDPH